MSKKKPAAVKSKTTVSKRKKSAAVPPPQGRGAAKPKATRAPGRAVSLLPQVRAIVDGPNSPKGAVLFLSDTGTGPTQADMDKSNSLAQRLKDDLAGWNYAGHDDSIYNELIQSSNVVFALTLGKYKQLTGTGLIADINSDSFYGWDVIDNIIAKANQLNLT
jgi:hypothetical protein